VKLRTFPALNWKSSHWHSRTCLL